jgi:outer membrane receptor protein involved in Fe transport
LSWKAASTAMVQLEMVKVGAYFMDQLNTQRYNGYALYNLRSTVQLTRDLSMSAQLLNLTNQRYADSASGTGTAALYAPGLPRTAYVGLNMRY